MLDFLREEGIEEAIIKGISEYRQSFPWDNSVQKITKPRYFYYGRDIWNQAAAALLAGENLLLVGAKATGKNVLAENLSAVFGRPQWNVSFHINMDASFMLGTDTFADGAVKFRPGPVYQSAVQGGFCVLDEINMARNEALAVLHSLLDFRRIMDVPGYDRLHLNPAARFIATMNYGYAGTRELNEALTSRFVVLHLPEIDEGNLEKLLATEFPTLEKAYRSQFAKLFLDLQKKCDSAEISSKAVDLRGLLDALRLMERGLSVHQALAMGVTNKSFDSYERNVISDIIALRLTEDLKGQEIFTK